MLVKPPAATTQEPPVAIRVAALALVALMGLIALGSIAGSLALRRLSVPAWDYQSIARWAAVLGILAGAAATALWMVARQGWRNAALLLLLCVGVAGGAEVLGVLTGFPFGRYAYTDQLGPRLAGLVPYAIPFAWFMLAYPALHLAHWLSASAPVRALLAGGLLTLWDLALDPAATARWPAWGGESAGGLSGGP